MAESQLQKFDLKLPGIDLPLNFVQEIPEDQFDYYAMLYGPGVNRVFPSGLNPKDIEERRTT